MYDQTDLGKRIKEIRQKRQLTQKEIAYRIGVSEQAISKWENGVCLPDVYNLRLLSLVLQVSTDCLLDTETVSSESVIETIKIGEASFELIEKPQMILAGKIIYAKDYEDYDSFNLAIESYNEAEKQKTFDKLVEQVLPIYDMNLSVDFWLDEKQRAYGFVREVVTEEQPKGVSVYKTPASLYIRAYTDKETSKLLAKEQCETWELFSYIRSFFMPAHGFRMASDGAQELEVFDTFEHKCGYAYVPVERV